MHSNAYTYKFIIILTGIAALLLSLASTGLKDKQDFNREIDTKKNILKAVGIFDKKMKSTEVEDLFNKNITEKFVTKEGVETSDKTQLQVFIFGNGELPKGYILPISGKGLWSTVNGFLALEPDLNTIKGITFYEHGETPGLGGEIDKDWFTSNFKGKTIFEEGKLVSVKIAKGQLQKPNPHEVDGISGATLTTQGLNEFILEDLQKYINFLKG
ncbi:MAG: NADH:ubiquinone reductase (Na(+)-transporting) subunit C [Candidatus Marinimicrobia bacterium]|nr:NADH:ubiquinone reductase (Na(+)-transporting) subunit C [Candidatus Neomarinimicrobiota bacterium]MBL7022987.1 NADH:ubiquinone reductase (Na(+)-transporting) subunit C [Candidatus Neomarinimicrobiota bacterium]